MKFDALKKELAFYADVTSTNTSKAEFDNCTLDCVDLLLNGLSDFDILYHVAIPFSEICADLHKTLACEVIEAVTEKINACREIMQAIHSETPLYCSMSHRLVFVFCCRFRPFDAQFHDIACFAEDYYTESIIVRAESYTITTREKVTEIFEQLTECGYTRIVFNGETITAHGRNCNEKNIIFRFAH